MICDNYGYLESMHCMTDGHIHVKRSKKKLVPASNQIFYTTNDGNIYDMEEIWRVIITEFDETIPLALNLVSNTYSNGLGILTFDGDVMALGLRYNEDIGTIDLMYPMFLNILEMGLEIETDFVDNLTSIILPDVIEAFHTYSIYGCKFLTELYIPANINYIAQLEGTIVANTALESIIVDPNNTVFDSRDNCNAIIATDSNELVIGCKESIIPNTVMGIGLGAFAYCENLTSIIIPNNIIYIDISAFYNCENLNTINVLPTTPPELGDNAFYNTSCPIYVPAESVSAYQSAWPDYADRIQANIMEFVDLSLPSGTLWAACNIGATCGDTVESWYGDYYAWGETELKDEFTPENYTYHDNPNILPADHDIATITCGNGYRIPTLEECQELIDNTTCEEVSDYNNISGLNGFVFTSDNGNSIFIPFAGYNYQESFGTNFYIWLNSLDANNKAFELTNGSESHPILDADDRYFGQSIRPIKTIN